MVAHLELESIANDLLAQHNWVEQIGCCIHSYCYFVLMDWAIWQLGSCAQGSLLHSNHLNEVSVCYDPVIMQLWGCQL